MTQAISGLCMGCMGQLKGQRVCPRCGYDADSGYDPAYIKPGTLIGSRYLAGRVVHKNGEGAKYIGYDSALGVNVWIHEYFPHTIASRGEETGTILPGQGFGAQYKALMSDFVDICNEVKRLSVTEPVIPIEDVVYENNTVYAVYKDLDVVPLELWLERQGGSLPLEEALGLFLPLLNTLSNIHGQGQIHRGISPYTVYIDDQGRLFLWDFALGATRTANSEIESELFSGYSAPEQYSTSGWQDTWTDVYAAAALLYRILSGIVPPRSTLIGPGRPLVPLEDLVMGLPKSISEAVADAMRVPAEQRTQAVATLTSQLLQSGAAGASTSTAIYDTNRVMRASGREVPHKSRSRKQPAGSGSGGPGKGGGGSFKFVLIPMALTVVLLGVFIAWFVSNNTDLLGIDEESGGTTLSDASAPEPDGEESGGDDTISEVPRFVGQQLNQVQSDSRYRGVFEFSVQEEFNENYDEGVIYDQSPTEGTPIQSGTIILHVSKGTKMIEMPELVGLTVEEAVEILKEMDDEIRVDQFIRRDSEVGPGEIMRTTPEAGAEFDPKRQTVYLFYNPEEESQPESSTDQATSQPGREESSTGSIFDGLDLSRS